MKYFVYSQEKEISADFPEELTIEQAMLVIDKHPAEDEFEGAFIGFVDDNDDTLQFIRMELDSWLLDHPVVHGGEYHYSYQEDNLTTEKIKTILTDFFGGNDWKKHCKLQKV